MGDGSGRREVNAATNIADRTCTPCNNQAGNGGLWAAGNGGCIAHNSRPNCEEDTRCKAMEQSVCTPVNKCIRTSSGGCIPYEDPSCINGGCGNQAAVGNEAAATRLKAGTPTTDYACAACTTGTSAATDADNCAADAKNCATSGGSDTCDKVHPDADPTNMVVSVTFSIPSILIKNLMI